MAAYTRHNEVLILDSWQGDVNARYFNAAQTALKRLDKPIRFKIPTLNHLDLIVQADAWIVVDRVLNDVPVVAWTDFQTEGRDNLHEAIACEIRLYHFAARMILNTTLDAMEDILGQYLVERRVERRAENRVKSLDGKKSERENSNDKTVFPIKERQDEDQEDKQEKDQ